MAWFQLLANGDATDPNDYNQVTSPGCSGANHICAIQTSPDVNNKPVFTTSLRNEMITALNTNSSSTNVQLRTNP
ncbi:hypothetical protein OHD16_19465 [Sphingobacterium sp. ML3W]|jgi:hypothetical protein|uniref:hypothetical protein n=1 Tax=Sphingobacterium TaxID=28453 RepID=UPI0011C40FB8|nr:MULTISPECIES: hypothetical protein [Sphingobacterium]MDF2515921.1 hypothetical protein [Sphingobacterium sp.]QIH32843.1 hypothetical protein G6053_08020 [Sphingobacterium sp. DR205]WFA82138.1 hypothetical protein OGI71_12605 [Sphingobacterium sp. ML3W]